MYTLGDLSRELNRSTVYLRGLQVRFDLPAFTGARYSDAYLAFLRTIVFLRLLNVAEDTLRDLWQLERKLLQLLHVDSAGSPTWFLDACGETGNPARRLLLSNYDLGGALATQSVQFGLDFAAQPPELFAGQEMGEDALRVLDTYRERYARIQADVQGEVPIARAAVNWAGRLRA